MNCMSKSIIPVACLVLCLVDWTIAQTPFAATDRSSGYEQATEPGWQDTGFGIQDSCGCGGNSGCLVCAGMGKIPKPVRMSPPSQPTGVTAGACGPCIQGIDCAKGPPGEKRWCHSTHVDFDPLWHGEYIGPVRLPSLLEYRLRVNDEITFTYIPNRERSTEDYRLMVGDTIGISSVADPDVKRDKVQVQPDGRIYLPILDAPIEASGKTVSQLRRELEGAYKKYLISPAINVEPASMNTALADLLDSVNGPFAAGGRTFVTTVNPDGRIQLPLLGSVNILGMSIDEIKREINLRYRDRITGIQVEPRLTRMAPHFFFVFGRVAQPGRFEMLGPTTVTAGLAQAGGISFGGNARQVVVFRRAEDWRLISTMLDLRGGHLGKRPNPSDEIWLRDSDLLIVPDTPIVRANDAARLIFTDGVYRILPFSIQRQ